MGIFIHVEIDQDKLSPEIAEALVQLCPVDIFRMEGDQLGVGASNEDECTLCELCLMRAPRGAIRIQKLYKNETLVSSGQ
jgi:NAD-dependent dihydropyrimidine dehydrogenase PreA subunit